MFKKYSKFIKLLSVSFNEYEDLIETKYLIKLEYSVDGKSTIKNHVITMASADDSFTYESDIDGTPYESAIDTIMEIIETEQQFSMGAELVDEQYQDEDQEWYFTSRKIVFDEDKKEWISLDDWFPNNHNAIYEQIIDLRTSMGTNFDPLIDSGTKDIANRVNDVAYTKKIHTLKTLMKTELIRNLEILKSITNDLYMYNVSNHTLEILKHGKELFIRKQRLSKYLLVANVEFMYKDLVSEETFKHIVVEYNLIEELAKNFDLIWFESKRKEAVI